MYHNVGHSCGPFLDVPLEGDQLLKKCVSTFIIYRNGSVSERLWGLIMETADPSLEVNQIPWLATLPDDIWDIVRDSLLRCS